MNYLLNWGELNPKQRELAVAHRLNEIIEAIVEGYAVFDGAIGASIQAARNEVDRLQTPWFYGQAIYDKVGDLLTQIATSEAQAMMYRNPACEVRLSDCWLGSTTVKEAQ